MDYKINPENLLQLIKGRRSVRKWLDRSVEDWKIQQILEAGAYAPSGANDQRQRFMVIRDHNLIKKICDIKTDWCIRNNPPLIILVLSDLDPPGAQNNLKPDKIWWRLLWQDTAASMENMILMAEALGLASCWVSIALPSRIEATRKLLELEDRYQITCSLFLGYGVMTPDIETAKWLGRPVKRNVSKFIISGTVST